MALTFSSLSLAGPILLETAIKHYLMRKTVTKDSAARDEFLFDEAFVLVKAFLEISTKHTVDELQKFSLTKTPSPPWVLIHRVLIPISPCCTKAAEILIQALGGEAQALKIAGGTKWWTVRAQSGVEGEWIGIKKDFRAEEKRRKKNMSLRKATQDKLREERIRMSGGGTTDTEGEGESGGGAGAAGAAGAAGKEKGKEKAGDEESEEGAIGPDGKLAEELDSLRCMLYIHGGAYYWGSINTHRYTIWRYARKMHGRAFAVNYRKAPQFPFPCALHDCIAAYLYLLNPPPESKHRPIDPRNLIIAGDSAGGGLVLALLQVIRDTGLPMPAGAVCISPWSDLTHSFPSVMANTATDIIPPYGFIHKPSTLWPPPPPALTEKVQKGLRSKASEVVQHWKDKVHKEKAAGKAAEPDVTIDTATTAPTIPKAETEETTARGDTKIGHIHEEDPDGPNASTLSPVSSRGTHHQVEPSGEKNDPSYDDPAKEEHYLSLMVNEKKVTIRSQIQLYCTNDQLSHPYVSPALGNLAGLPPLLVIASDKEVLRDEIIYVAHKAAHPEKYPIRDSIKEMLPSLKDSEGKYPPTRVHLQVYDDCCHVLPLFSMCEPAKHCYRSIASFCRFVTHSARAGTDPAQQPVTGDKRQTSVPTPQPSTLVSPPAHSYTTPIPATDSKLEPMTVQTEGLTSSPGGTRPSSPEPMSAREDSSILQGTTRSSTIPSTSSSLLEPPPTARKRGSFRGTLQSAAPYLFGAKARRESLADEASGSDTGGGDGMSSDGGLVSPPPEISDSRRTSTSDGPSPTTPSQIDFDFPSDEIKVPKDIPVGYAGNAERYSSAGGGPFQDNMIRERVAGKGACRPLEPESEISALNMPAEQVGVVKEGPAMRYLNGQELWDERYKNTAKRIAKRREDHLKRSAADAAKAVSIWKDRVLQKREDGKEGSNDPDDHSYLFEGELSWAWALRGEKPPPTAIIARRDTNESRNLARQADRITDDSMNLGGLSLWTAMASFFSKDSGAPKESSKPKEEEPGVKVKEHHHTLSKLLGGGSKGR